MFTKNLVSGLNSKKSESILMNNETLIATLVRQA